jgi:phosphatidylglycerophosphate synthase
MAELGQKGRVKVTVFGKLKTIFQMIAIAFLLYREDLGRLPLALIGEFLLYLAAGLTLWSMWVYLRSAWPAMSMAQSAMDEDGAD